jgi:parallel beta-helix repeat protein
MARVRARGVRLSGAEPGCQTVKMQSRHSFALGLFGLVSGALMLSCSSDTAKTGADGGGPKGNPEAGPEGGACNVTLSPSADDHTTVQGALDSKVKSGDVVCFNPGTYHFTNQIALSAAPHVTFRGLGKTRNDVVLDFKGQTTGTAGVFVTTDYFTVENLWIKNTAGNGIEVQAAYSHFDNIKVGWDSSATVDGGPSSGGYAIYPTGFDHVLLENSEAYGAADAGIYTGQCSHVIVRNNESHDNVLGIEIENSIGAEIYGNDVHDNSTGFLFDLLPHLQQKVAQDYLIHDNHVHDNNHVNFAAPSLAATAPQGTGMLVLASKDIDITKNVIENNGGSGVLIVSFQIIDLLALRGGSVPDPADPTTNRYPARVYVHDNTLTNNGTKPVGVYAELVPGVDGGKIVPGSVIWDGYLDPKGYGDSGVDTAAAAKICLGAPEQKTFLDFNGDSVVDSSKWTTDTGSHQCTLPDVPALSL